MAKLSAAQHYMNQERIDRASRILNAYQAAHDTNEETDTVLTDLLADLMHAAKDRRVDFESALSSAQIHFEAEQNGDE